MYKIFAFLALSIVILFSACKKDEPDADPCDAVTYSATIAPIITTSCASATCHGSGATIGDFTTHAGIAAAAASGDLKREVIDDETMPPSGALSDAKQDQILCWINDGAPNN